MSSNSSTDSLKIEIAQSLKDARWPITKDEALELANQNRARPQVIDAINAMSYDKFYSMEDVKWDYVND